MKKQKQKTYRWIVFMLPHWRLKYVSVDNFQDASEKLKEGKVDLVAPVQQKDLLMIIQ